MPDIIDPEWYLARYPDVVAAGMDPRDHYVTFGRDEGRFATAHAEGQAELASQVDPEWYLARYPDVVAAGMDPRDHYVTFGRDEGRFATAHAEGQAELASQVDPEWYLARYLDVVAAGMDPRDHYVTFGRHEGRFATAHAEGQAELASQVDPEWYLARYPDVVAAGMDPRDHYVTFGRHEGRFATAHAEGQAELASQVDPEWYLARYPDVVAAGMDPRDHYVTFGRHEGRFATAHAEGQAELASQVDPEWYLARYPDVVAAGMDPRDHYVTFGRHEGRFATAHAEGQAELASQVDPEWYLARYPDVVAAGMDPRDHYVTFGRHEGRFATAHAEGQAELASQVDPEWYLARYPDVVAAGMDPRDHYVTFGWHEGRFPNVAHEPPEVWSARFDPVWYEARNRNLGTLSFDPLKHFRTIGIIEGRAPNAYEEKRDAWKDIFDAHWYLERNTDVLESRADPLEHYLTRGILEHRRPNRFAKLPSTDVIDADITCLKAGQVGAEVALFVTFSIDGNIKPHVLHYVQSLKMQEVDCILIVTSDHKFVNIPQELQSLVDAIYLRESGGYDFAAWAHILHIRPKILHSRILYLVNDRLFGPTSHAAFENIFTHIRASDSELIGLTDNSERGWHIQSYFLAIKHTILLSQIFRKFVLDIVSFEHKDDVVNEYETQLSRHLMQNGFKCETLFPTPGLANSTLYNWKNLLEAGFPFLKVSTARGLSKGIDLVGWRELATLQGYDTAPADRTLSKMAARTSIPPVSLSDRKFNHRQEARSELYSFFATHETIDLPAHPEPVISVLIVVYNEAELTFRCLQSMVATIDVPAEFIIIDNASTDDTRYLLNKVRNARIVRNVEDLHFLRAANQAAARARGRALLFLNNDIRLEPNAVRFGLETLDSANNIGAVGAKLILTDGTLQEAGSIIWSDGACLGYGRGDSPEKYQYNFRRDVDFCSGAYMMVRRDLFEDLLRFDTIYAPAYYEETDLCMRMHAAGFRVIYDPRIVVNHYEFASVAYDGEGSSLMQRNFGIFVSRHQPFLARHHLPQDQSLLLARSRGRHRKRLLMIDNLMPLDSYGAGFPRTNRILSSLNQQGFDVTYYSTSQNDLAKDERLANCPIDVEFVLGGDRPSLFEIIEERAGYYDGIVVCRPNNMKEVREHFLKDPSPYKGVALIYDAEAVCAPREAMRQALQGDAASHDATNTALNEELELSDIADLTVVVNERDARYFRAIGRGNVNVLGYALKIEPTRSIFEERHGFLFVGRLDDDSTPNTDSLFWFIDYVMPKLDLLIGDGYQLTVAGTTGSKRLAALSNERITVLGRVDDLKSHYDKARIFLGPTRYAAGIPLKIYEAAARGVPTVITPLLGEQMGWLSEETTLIASQPDEFAKQCQRLYTDKPLWNKIRDSAIKKVEIECSSSAFDSQLALLLNSLNLRP